MTKPKAVIFDIDNTLSDVRHLMKYVEGPGQDFAEFHRQAVDADPIPWVVDQMAGYVPDHYVFIITARSHNFREATEEWLGKHVPDYPDMMLLMREIGDDRSDYEVKLEHLTYIQKYYHVVHAYDDSPHTTHLWIEHGIPTTVIPGSFTKGRKYV